MCLTCWDYMNIMHEISRTDIILSVILDICRFQVKKKQFFKNFSTILSFGVLGTLISFCLVSSGKTADISGHCVFAFVK